MFWINKIGDQKASPFPGMLHFTFKTYLILLSIKQGSIIYHFKVFGMTLPGIETGSPGPWANSLPTRQMSHSSEFQRLIIFFDLYPKMAITRFL